MVKKDGAPAPNTTVKKIEESRPPRFPIVGFGASAGGLEAFSALLQQIKPNLGMAYVLIMHLSPTHKSALPEILQSKTKMPVHSVQDGMKLQPNHLYVIPPNTFMSVVDGHLKLAPRTMNSLGNFVIDYFMTTLAEIYKNKAVGVILSGTASDGTLGLKAIKAYGGITFAQDSSAKFPGMPRNAIEGGFVDYILSPDRIAKELQGIVKSYAAVPTERIDHAESESVDKETLRKILRVVKDRWSIDFDLHYKWASIYRRIVRRMALNKSKTLRDYFKYITKNDKEIDSLYDDFLINVTTFFRDPAFFKALNDRALPAIVKGREQSDPIRVWVAGCSTGEEVFSIAICILEFLQRKQLSYSVQIFGSDLDSHALTKARTGIYSLSSLAGVNMKRLNTYFKRIDGNYQVTRQLRDACVFSQHNLLSDPPFSRIDIVSCQNVLIYMESNPQKRILQSFHFALKPTGYLFLGKSETATSSSEMFESMDKRVKMFSRKSARTQPIDFLIRPLGTAPERAPAARPVKEKDFGKEIEKIMLSRFVFPGVVIDHNLMIVQFFGDTSKYLAPVTGKATLNVLKMIKEDLVVELRGLIQIVQKNLNPAVSKEVMVRGKNTISKVSIEVLPYHTVMNEQYFLVIFRETNNSKVSATSRENKLKEKGNSDLVRLEQELMQSREVIRTTAEEYESTYEELQTNNEMILSSNEELQSVNEELETSKEELQSANEELTTINEELFKRNLDLKESQSFADAIIQTVHNPLLVLTVNLQVRMANRAFYKAFKLDPENTEGRFLYELGNNSWDIDALREHLKNIFPNKTSFKDFELRHTFPGIGEKTLVVNAYKLEKENDIKETLILLAFDDVTRRLNAEASLLKTQEQLKLSLIGDSIGTWWWDLRSNDMKWSRENEILNGVKEGTFNGTYSDWENLIDLGDLSYVQKSLNRNILDRSPVEIEYRIRKPDRSIHWIMSKGHVYYGSDNKPERMIGVSMEITERKMQSNALEMKVDQRTRELQTALENIKNVNQQLEEFAFISSHDLQEPLRKITTFASLLGRPEAELNEYATKYVTKMQDSTQRMSLLLKALLRYSTLLKTHVDSKAAIDLDVILDRVEKYHHETFKEKSVVLERSGLPTVYGYDEHLFQLFCHLVDNALKFSKDSPIIKIGASALEPSELASYPQLDRNKKYAIVEVSDNGIGFEQKYAVKIFQMFQKLDVGKTNDGTGLGLAISKKIVEEHGGIIYATGIPNAGARFTLILPIR